MFRTWLGDEFPFVEIIYQYIINSLSSFKSNISAINFFFGIPFLKLSIRLMNMSLYLLSIVTRRENFSSLAHLPNGSS